MDEHGGHEDLCGSGLRSVIPYVHGKTELNCSSLPCLKLPFRPPREVAPARAFYNSRLGSYIETRSPIGGPVVVETLYSI
jgi:hypothetical protein